MIRPLEGISVVDVGTLTPGKYCSYLLADLGANVIRVERPSAESGPVDDEDLILNQGKRSITLDLRSDAGKALFLQLVGDVDVVLEGNRPGTADRNGFGYSAIKPRNEAVVYCALSGYGATGPLSQAPGYDLMFLGLSGLLRALGGNVATPPVPHAYLADAVAGLNAACAIIVALFARERTGEGAFIDLAMLDSAFSLLAVSHGVRKSRGTKPSEPADSPVYNVYAAADDTYLVLGAIRGASVRALFSHLGRPELAESTQRGDVVHAFLQQAFLAKSADAWVEVLTPLDVEIAQVNHPHEAFDHPQLQHRGMIGTTSHADSGDIEFIRPSLNSSFGVRTPSAPAPRHGEHTEEILKSLGVTDARFATLRKDGVV